LSFHKKIKRKRFIGKFYFNISDGTYMESLFTGYFLNYS
jgi:hypothetical protein